MYKTITLAALSTLLFMSCEKENIDNTIDVKKTETIIEPLNRSNHRGSDEEFIMAITLRTNGGQTILDNGTINIVEAESNSLVKTMETNNVGQFETKIREGNYLLNCYKNDIYIGTSDVLKIREDSKVTVVF